jgi:hypothetical protein
MMYKITVDNIQTKKVLIYSSSQKIAFDVCKVKLNYIWPWAKRLYLIRDLKCNELI